MPYLPHHRFHSSLPLGPPQKYQTTDNEVPTVMLKVRGEGELRTVGGSNQDPNPMHPATHGEEVQAISETLDKSDYETLDSVVIDVYEGDPLAKMKLSELLKRNAKLRK